MPLYAMLKIVYMSYKLQNKIVISKNRIKKDKNNSTVVIK